MAKYLIGSQYFFYEYPDFYSSDIDEIEIIDTTEFNYMRHLSGHGKCLFQLKRKNSVEEYIRDALNSNLGMALGKFLVPEFCAEIGFQISDLPKLQKLIDVLDKKHLYEKIIFDSYLKNQTMTLTKDQKTQAYLAYKESRGI